MSTTTPGGADGPSTPAGKDTEEPSEELEAELVEEVEGEPAAAASPEVATTPNQDAAVAAPASTDEEVETIDVEPDPTGEVAALAPRPPSTPVAPAPPVPPARPALPGMRVAPRPAPPGAQPPAPAEPEWPTLDETIAAARAKADERAKPSALAALYEAELAALGPQSRARQAVYAHEVGELAALGGDEGGAVKAWARALQADPSLRPNLWAIRRAFQRRAMWPNVLRLIDAELRFAQGAVERAELMVERGSVLEDRMNDAAGATNAFDAAVKEDPNAIRAFMALERRLLEEGSDPERHRRVLGGLAAATRDPARRAALLVDLARLEAEAGGEGIQRARAALDEALTLELGDGNGTHFAGSGAPAALDELERLALRASRPEWRMDALETRLRLLDLDSVARPPASEADAEKISRGIVLRLRQATLAEEREDPAAAIGFIELAAQLSVSDPSAAHMVSIELGRLATAAGRAEVAARVALGAAAEAPASLRGSILLEAVDGFDRAGLADEATAAAAQAEAAGLGDAVEARTRRRYERSGDDAGLLRTYVTAAERAIASDDPGSGAAAFARAAAIAGEQLGQHDEALTLRQRGWTIAPVGPLREELADSTEWTLARLGRFDEWSAFVERRLAEEAPGPRRLVLLERRAGLLAERLGDVAGAMTALEEIAAAKPDDTAVRYELVGLARFAGDPARAAAQLREIVTRTTDDARKSELELERGSLLLQAGDAAAAETSFREALRLAPGDGRARAALEELFEHRRRSEAKSGMVPTPVTEAGRADGLIAALRSELDANLSPDRATQLLSRLAELQERERRDPTAAAAAYQEMFDRAGEPDEQAAALRGLGRAYAVLGDRDRLVAALEREHELLAEAPARAMQRARIAWVKERRGDPNGAEDDHGRLLDTDGDLTPEQRATARLGRLRAAYRSGNPTEIAATLGGVVGAVDPELVATRAALDLEHAAALTANGEHDEAAVVAARALAAQPDNKSAQLASLWTSGRRGDLRGVTSALFALGDAAASPTLRAPLVRRGALLSLVAGSEPAEAASRLAAVGARDDASILVRGELGTEADVLVDRLSLAESQGRVPWLMMLAEAQAARGELAQSSATLSQLLELEPRSLFALELDRRIRKATGDRVGSARRTLALGELLVEAERAAALLVEAGEAFESLGDVRLAVYAFREVLQRTPFDGAVHARARTLLLAEIAQPGDDAEPRRSWARSALLELYDLRLQNVDELAEKVTSLVERADLYLTSGDRTRAEADLRAVLDLDPDEARGLWPLVQLCAQDGARLEETRELVARLAAVELEPAQRRAMHLVAGSMESHGQGDPERAVAAFEAAIAIEEDLPTLRTLAALLVVKRAWQRAIEVRRRLVARVPAEEGARLELEIANIYIEGFTDSGAAKDAALRALALDPASDGALAVLAKHGRGNFADANATRILDAALEAARAQLADEEARRVGTGRIAAIAALRAEDELRVLAEQLGALYDGRAAESRPVAALLDRSIAGVAKQVVRSALLESPLTALFGGLAESLSKLYPLAAAQAGKLAKVSSKQRDGELGVIVSLGKMLGLPELELALGEGQRVDSNEEHLVVGRAVVPALGRAAARFRVARGLALFGDRLGALDRMDDAAVVAFVAGALAFAKLEWPAELAALKPAAAVVEERAKAIDKVIARKEKKALLAVGPALSAMPDPRRFRAAVLASASRAALFVTADLAVASEELGVPSAIELGRVATAGAFIEARRAWLGGGR